MLCCLGVGISFLYRGIFHILISRFCPLDFAVRRIRVVETVCLLVEDGFHGDSVSGFAVSGTE